MQGLRKVLQFDRKAKSPIASAVAHHHSIKNPRREKSQRGFLIWPWLEIVLFVFYFFKIGIHHIIIRLSRTF
jgi:hypothetical protein